VYVCLDVSLQEAALDGAPAIPDPARHALDPEPAPAADTLAAAARMLAGARHPLILAGRVSRSWAHWALRVRLAERLGARVVTDLKTAAAFPTEHPLHPNAPGFTLSPEDQALVRQADVILSLDWLDLGGTLAQAYGGTPISARVISASVDHLLTNASSYDHFALPTVDLAIPCPPDAVLAPLLEILGDGDTAPADEHEAEVLERGGGERLDLEVLARATATALAGRDASILRLPLGWAAALTPFCGPLDYFGFDGGAGIGSGPGMAVGMALALIGSGRLPVAVLGDGDLLMGASALWTAAHYRIPLLVVVANNRSYFNDEMHQERIARARGRPVENRWIGQRLEDPAVDVTALAASLGLRTVPPVQQRRDLAGAFARAIDVVDGGEPCLLDVQIEGGYSAPVAPADNR
jgi:thiamine pyrophosphate-dependent acetolactate synthase large subunit-like protein